MIKKSPTLYTLFSLLHERYSVSAQINGKWVPARPLPFYYGLYSVVHRLKLSWMVFTGKADVVTWPEGQ